MGLYDFSEGVKEGEKREADCACMDEKTAERITRIMDQLADRKTEALHLVRVPACDPEGAFFSIQAYTYDGMDADGRKTKVFAYIGFPDNLQQNEKVPGVVLVHGGGGHAFAQWVKAWNDRGYAAIAMDTTGSFPYAVKAGAPAGASGEWIHGPYGIFEEEGYCAAPDFDDMNPLIPAEEMWMYHAVGQVLLANAVLGTFDAVDRSRIGLVGISWGSVISALAIGYKNSFAFAVPIYGGGYLDESLSWMGERFASKRIQTLWSAQDRFSRVKIPVLWLCMNDDTCFSLNVNSKSYIATAPNHAKTALSIKNGWVHGHDCCWDTANYPCYESFAFADSIVGKGPQYTAVADQPEAAAPGSAVSCTFTCHENASVRAKLYYLTERYAYTKQPENAAASLCSEWQSVSADVDRRSRTVMATVPPEATCYYLELTTEQDGISYITASRFINLREQE